LVLFSKTSKITIASESVRYTILQVVAAHLSEVRGIVSQSRASDASEASIAIHPAEAFAETGLLQGELQPKKVVFSLHHAAKQEAYPF